MGEETSRGSNKSKRETNTTKSLPEVRIPGNLDPAIKTFLVQEKQRWLEAWPTLLDRPEEFDLEPEKITPLDAKNIAGAVDALKFKFSRDALTDLYLKSCLVQSLKRTPTEVLQKEVNDLARIYRQFPACMSLEHRGGREGKGAETGNSQGNVAQFYNRLNYMTQIDLTRVLLASGTETAGKEIAGQVARLSLKKNYLTCEILKAVSASAQDTETPLSPGIKGSLQAELSTLAGKESVPRVFTDFTQITTDDRGRSGPARKTVDLNEVLTETLKALTKSESR